MIKRLLPYAFILLLAFIFFWQVFFKGLLPIPSDTIVGLYYPYRDEYAKSYPNGIPFKNFLITDPVRQQYPWKKTAIESYKNGKIPSWNSFSFSGTPSLANFQTGAYYPFNLLGLFLPFNAYWSLTIILTPFLAGIFMFLYLRNLKLEIIPSMFGSITYSYGGFFATWLEWGNILSTALWLPLILLSIDKLIHSSSNDKQKILSWRVSQKGFWAVVLFTSLTFSFFAGHLQTFFYIFVLSFIYAMFRLYKERSRINFLLLGISFFAFVLVTAVQWIPSLRFISLSARATDQNYLTSEGWFIPLKHLVQFIIPDFFGNPSTLNYWGTWNYAELTGYIGVASIILAILAIISKRSKLTTFFAFAAVISLLLAISNPISRLPYHLNIPFISTAQPTRLMFIVDFTLSILAAFGLESVLKGVKRKNAFAVIGLFSIIFLLLFLVLQQGLFKINSVDLQVALRNMILPLLIFIAFSFILLISTKLNKRHLTIIASLILVLTITDLFRFSWKFNTFGSSSYLFPDTHVTKYVQENLGEYRIATNDPRLLPPNFSQVYQIPTVDGYDALFLKSYAEYISAINRGKPDISQPYGFNRIVSVKRFDSKLVDLLGVKYLLSLNDVRDPKFVSVYEFGLTKVYENQNVLPKAFIVNELIPARDNKRAIEIMFGEEFDPATMAVVEGNKGYSFGSTGSASVTKYEANRVEVEVEVDKDSFMVLTDVYYPTWRVKLDNDKMLPIQKTNYLFKGVFIPKGKHVVVFYNSAI